MKNKIILSLVVLVLAGVAGVFGIKAWRNNVAVKQEQRAFARAHELLAQGQPAGALELEQTMPLPNTKLDWPAVEVGALAGLREAGRLAHIYETAAPRVLTNEEASLVLARAYMSSRDMAAYNKLRPLWRGHETRQDDWVTLDCDLLTLQGKPRDAEKLLRSRTLTGKAEMARLERLALMVAPRDLAQAWQLLDQASAIDPRNPEIRSFRGQILESIGNPGAAQVEYTAALAAEPNNPVLRDQLADFYLRQGNYDNALMLWEKCLADPTFDYVWLKTAFWSRMIRPVTVDGTKSAQGELQPLVQWLAALPDGTFGDTNSFALLPQARTYQGNRQEVFWLQLADDLQHHREAAAADKLKFNPFHARSYQPDLESALVRILHYRKHGSFNPTGFQYSSPLAAAGRHQLFTQLDELAAQERTTGRVRVPADLDALLRGPDAFAAAFLAAGWREAALNLAPSDEALTNIPAWYPYGIAQTLRVNRGAAAAEKYLARQSAAPELQLLRAELKIGDGQAKEGIGQLPALARLDSPVGYRASYLLALACVDNQQYDTAQAWVRQNRKLAADVTGQDLLADIALKAGRVAEAETIFRANLNQSLSAKEYFAKQAFDRRNWTEARRLTTELLRLAPDQLKYRANLAAIDRAEAATQKKN